MSGQAVTYTATVTAVAPASGTPSGSASFMDGATTISGCIAQPLIGGVATCSVAYSGVGSHSVTAVYSGDPDFTGSTSPVLTQMVTPASTSTSLTSSVDPSVTGQVGHRHCDGDRVAHPDPEYRPARWRSWTTAPPSSDAQRSL